MSTINVSLSNVNNPLQNVGFQQPSVSETGNQVQLGETTHTVATNPQATQNIAPGGQPFPSSVDTNVTTNVTTQLGVQNTPVQPQPIENRTVAAAGQTTAAGQANAPRPKAYKFTFAQLKAICNGDYNVGEVALDKNGKLTKVNNHVTMSFLNKTVMSPAANARLRQQICDCIVDQFFANLAQDVKDALTNNLKDILLGEGRDSQSLSRDELKYLLHSGLEGGLLHENLGALKSGLAEIRNFKQGHWEGSATWQSSKDELIGEGNADPSNDRIRSRYLLHMRSMIKGLDTVEGQQVRDPGEGMIVSAALKQGNLSNVCAVSVNAKRDVVRNALRPFAEELKRQLFADAPNGQKSVVGLRRHVHVNELTFGGVPEDILNNAVNRDLRLDSETFGGVCIYKDDFAALVTAAVEQVNVQDVSNEDRLKSNFCEKLMELLKNFAKSRLDRLNGPHTNPAKALRAKTYLRQSFYSYDKGGKKTTVGTNFCFMNSVINSVLASNNAKAKAKLAEIFTENGFKLYNNNGRRQMHTIDNGLLSKDGNISFYEQSLNQHFKLVKGQNYDYSAGDNADAEKVLGMRKVNLPEQEGVAYGDPSKYKANLTTFLNTLNGHLRSGRFVTYCDGSHFVAVKGIELLKNGAVKMSIVDDRANEKGKYEYDRTFMPSEFYNMCANLSFDVLEWPPEVQ